MRLNDDIEAELARLTAGIAALRIAYFLIHHRGQDMPPLIEIKGLGASVTAAKKGIADVRAATAGLSTEATALVAAIADVRTQIKAAHDDLKFEAETLGNGGETQTSNQS